MNGFRLTRSDRMVQSGFLNHGLGDYGPFGWREEEEVMEGSKIDLRGYFLFFYYFIYIAFANYEQ